MSSLPPNQAPDSAAPTPPEGDTRDPNAEVRVTPGLIVLGLVAIVLGILMGLLMSTKTFVD